MKKNLRNILLAAAALGCCATASAQSLNSAYFLDGYTYGHQLNPAKDYDRNGYVAFPFLGNLNLGMNGNIALTDVLKFNGDKLTTFMNPNIPMDEALSGFDADNNTGVDLRMDLIGFGFRAWGGFNTFNLSLRTNSAFNLPYGLFEAMKEFSNKDYDLSGLRMDATSWVELGLGHSRQVNEAWRVGGKAKFLLGAGRAMLNVKNAQLKLQAADKWILVADAEAEVSVKGFDWGEEKQTELNDGTRYDEIDFNNIDLESPGPNGWGLAFDLGAEWDLGKQGWVDGLKVSAAVLDLGFISWNETHYAYNRGKEVVIYGFNDVQVDGENGTTIEDQTDDYGDRFSELVALEDGGVKKSTSMLGATVNVGVEYEMPFYDKLSVGLLSTTRIQGRYTWNEERLGVTVSPVKWFEVSANVGFGTRGTSFGWVANIHPRGFNIFVGMDHTVTKLSKQYIPLGSNNGITLGINFPFGKSNK
ncbi:MAG: hypothetical protein IIW93_08945 [Bacteroidaceae bacterium]|nr:hypothetical protein [Bacteroidaceae bacterium]